MSSRAKVIHSIYRRQLAMVLKQLRTQADLSLAQVATALEINIGSLSRLENAERGTSPVLVKALLDHYGVTDPEERERLLNLVRADRAQRAPWWKELSAVLSPTQYDGFLVFESSAVALRSYQPSLVPGLLQTEDYARAVIRAIRVDLSPEQVEDLVSVRMARQAILRGGAPEAGEGASRAPTPLWAVLDEGVVRRMVGGRDVMRAQLTRLLETAQQPHITLQIMPFGAGAHAGLHGCFGIMEFDPPHPPIVWLENLTSTVFLEETYDVGRYTAVFDHLRAEAASPAASLVLIREVLKES